MAFVTGAPGDFSEEDLALLSEFVENSDEFFIPMLFDKSGVQNLFMSVDLV